MDFTMAYECEYQNEVKSALWTCLTVNLLTAACFFDSKTQTFLICTDSESGLAGSGVVIRIGRFPVQTLLGAWLGLGTQPRYEAPSDLLVEIVETW